MIILKFVLLSISVSTFYLFYDLFSILQVQ
jgi:hypothetical protein